jgi:hypothetical protein
VREVPNPFGVVDQLDEAERSLYDALDKTPPPKVLLKREAQVATVGWVERYVGTHARYCPALRQLRFLTAGALVLLGAVLAVNIMWVYSADSIVQAAVRKALVEQGVIRATLASTTRAAVATVGTP